jgi:hypothetical protein
LSWLAGVVVVMAVLVVRLVVAVLVDYCLLRGFL